MKVNIYLPAVEICEKEHITPNIKRVCNMSQLAIAAGLKVFPIVTENVCDHLYSKVF